MCLMGWLPLQRQLHCSKEQQEEASKEEEDVKKERNEKKKRKVKKGGEPSGQVDVDVSNGHETNQLPHADALLA